MFKNYIKIAWRNLIKDKTFTGLNIFGLSIAFAAAILLSIASVYELSFDNFHENKDRLFISYFISQTPEGAKATITQPLAMAPTLKEEVPGIKYTSRYREAYNLVKKGEKELLLDVAFLDNDYFKMFSFPIRYGTKNNLLEHQNSVVVTAESAKKIFGEISVIGKTLDIQMGGQLKPFVVSAVLKDLPKNTNDKFNIAVSIENMPDYQENLSEWGNRNHHVYVQLENGVAVTNFEKNAQKFTNLHFKGDIEDAERDGAQPNTEGNFKKLKLMPITDWHFVKIKNHLFEVSRNYPYLIFGIGMLIILIASVNFINMSIARSTKRLKEIGMRKTLGAAKAQLFIQFWAESVFIFLTSAIIGLLISLLVADPFQSLFRVPAEFSSIINPSMILGFLLILAIITLIAGGYPALLLSKLKTIQSLKGKLDMSGKNRLRNVLMVFQFSIAILLVTGTLVLWQQLHYMQNKNLGFNKEQVIAFPLNGKKSARESLKLLRNELQDNPSIVSISGADNILGIDATGSRFESQIGFEYQGRNINTNVLAVDYDYIKTLDLKLKEGRDFNRNFATDSLSLIINESMAKLLQEEEPLNKMIPIDDNRNYKIIGVLKDYNFQDLNREIAPLTISVDPNWDLYYAYIKVAPNTASQTYDVIKDAWANIEPNAEFAASFLDENIDRTFRNEKRLTRMITSGSIIAIILSCIGLFAMSILVVTQRTKEIGVRKIVGAGVTNITLLLTKDFLILVGIAFVIATPIAWYFTNEWLQNYVFRIELSLWFFIAAGVLSLLIAVATISFRTVKAALQNPVKSLRTE